MTRAWITPEEGEEVSRLLKIYHDSTLKAHAALGRYSTDAASREIARTEDAKAGEAYRLIREIYGDEAVRFTPSAKPFEVK
jgi:hypothetical protein